MEHADHRASTEASLREVWCERMIPYLVTFSGGTPLKSFHAWRMLCLEFVLFVTELKALKNP